MAALRSGSQVVPPVGASPPLLRSAISGGEERLGSLPDDRQDVLTGRSVPVPAERKVLQIIVGVVQEVEVIQIVRVVERYAEVSEDSDALDKIGATVQSLPKALGGVEACGLGLVYIRDTDFA
jgi:hypothetical protein